MSKRTETVLLFSDEDQAEIDRLQEAVFEAVNQAGPKRMNDADPAAGAAKAYDEYVTEATERAERVVVSSLPNRLWRRVVAEHPPREGNESDGRYGFNEEELGDSLLPFADAESGARTIIEPTLESGKALQEWLDDLRIGEYRKVYSAAVRVNVEVRPDPKADMSSRLAQISDET